MKTYHVYMMSNNHNSVLYIGITNDLIGRIHEHKNNLTERFTKKYNCHKLVWYQQNEDVKSAILQKNE